MIRYAITTKALQKLITRASADWLVRAEQRTLEFRNLGHFNEKSSIWSEVKSVYMKLQGDGKCAYCERQMESSAAGKVEQDVEHFRPKGNVKEWRISARFNGAMVSLTAVPGNKKGYHLLAYHPWNYAAACKPCNSALKGDYFPIAGAYQLDGDNPAKLKSEKPYLIYPIGSLDEDPEKLIEFHGTSPVAVADSGHARNRALITIDFFNLDDPEKRKNLYDDRSWILMGLFPLLQKTRNGTAAEKKAAEKTVNSFLKPTLRHLNCARSFVRLFKSDPVKAESYYQAVVAFLTSGSEADAGLYYN